MCWSDTASIYCLYLLGSLSPAVRLHSLAYSSFEVTGKMLLTFFLWFLLLSWGGQNKKDVKSYDWSLGLLCLFYQIGCVFQKKKHSVLSVHSYCVLIVCMCFTKPVHSQTRKPTCSHPSSKVAHSLKTNIINCDSLKQKQKKMASSSYIPTSTAHLNGLHLWLIHTPTAVATICHVVFKCLAFLWGFSLGSDQERNRLNGT